MLSGYECDRGSDGIHYCIETALHEDPDWHDLGHCFRVGWPERIAASIQPVSKRLTGAPDRLLFFDIETSGLGDSMVFLIGLMAWDGEHFVARQLLARSPEEERSILAETAETFRQTPSLVSFNGKSFDAPFINNRLERHGFSRCEAQDHLDLLYHARKQWGKTFGNCRLQTLETHLCGRTRVGDIPSSEIPGVYRRFLRDGDPEPLQPIIHHNLLDLIAMAELLLVMLES